MGVDVAQAIVAAGAAALLHAHPAGRQVELIVEHHHAVERHLEVSSASPTERLDSFMKVCGFSTMVRSPPRWPSVT